MPDLKEIGAAEPLAVFQGQVTRETIDQRRAILGPVLPLSAILI